MAYIKIRKQSDGSTRYTAIVRLRRGKTIVHQEARTFAHRGAAVTWAKHREVVLEDPSALTRVQHGAPTLAELIRWYIDTFETISEMAAEQTGSSGAAGIRGGHLTRTCRCRSAERAPRSDSACAHADGAGAFTPGSCLLPELSGRRQADLVTERSKARIVFELQREGVA